MVDPVTRIKAYPERMKPDLIINELSAPILIQDQGMKLQVDSQSLVSTLDGELKYRWLPTSAIEFEGTYNGQISDVSEDEAVLFLPDHDSGAPVILTSMTPGDNSWKIRSVFKGAVTLGSEKPFNRIRVYLANHPEYIGTWVKRTDDGRVSSFRGRLLLESNNWDCVVDDIPESWDLRERAKRDVGYFISHIVEIKHKHDIISPEEADNIQGVVSCFFGFTRGAWCGPLFPCGYYRDVKIWERIGAWNIDQPRVVRTWLPTKSVINLSSLFYGFMEIWEDTGWQKPLIKAIEWYIVANDPEATFQTTLIMSQVSLELLAWVELVETGGHYSYGEFRRLNAHQRIRELLINFGIDREIPPHMEDISAFSRSTLRTDGPETITRLRNAIVHATEDSRELIAALTPEQLWEASQLALQYLELALLGLFSYDGLYARRAWRGYKGEDEARVPWN